eukprot:g12063.t1
MTSWGLDLLSKLAASTSLDLLREDFPRKSDGGLNAAQFLAVVQRHIGQDDFGFSASIGYGHQGNQGCHGHGEADDVASKLEEIFKEMDVRGDGEVSWEDFSAYVLQLELLHDSKGAADNEHHFQHFAAHLGVDSHVRSGGISRVDYLPAPVDKLGLVAKGNEVVHLVGQASVEDDDEAPFRVVSGGGSGLARIGCSLRHDTAYKPHEVNAVHSLPGQDVVITSSSLGPAGPHVLTVWDLPTQEERSSEKQFLPALTCREETPTRQTLIFWAPVLEMVLTGSSGNGSLLGWELGPLRQSAKLWLHDAGITHIHELVGHAGGAPHVVTASLDGTIAVCGGTGKGGARGDGVLQRLQAHERGVAHMAFCLHHSLALSAGVFVNTVDTTPDVLVWKLDRERGLLECGKHARLRGHEGQVVGMVFAAEELELVTGGADGTFLVWHMPNLVLKQRFTRLHTSPFVDQAVSCFSIVPRSADRPMLLVAGMTDTAGLEIFARMKRKVHEALIKAEFCPYLQRFVTVSARRATVWDGKTGEALTTLTSERLLENDQADITAFSLDHQGHKLVVGADTGEIRACFSHSGSVIRQLDPHNGPVNWLSFAARKTDKCVFSVGGDGALHVLDDADATGYRKPKGTADAKRKQVTRHDRSRGKSRAEDDGYDAAIPVPSGQAEVEEAAMEGFAQQGQEAGAGKRGDGGRSVLLRQVALSAHDDDDQERKDTVGGPTGAATQRNFEIPPQQARGTAHANDKHPGSLEDDRLPVESREGSVGSTSSFGKSRFSKAARALMDASFRDELLKRELEVPASGEGSNNDAGGMLFAKPTFDMTACAADDHLSIIATSATSDGGIETTKPVGSGDGRPTTGGTASTRVGRPSSSLHLWDAETMSLLGTLLLPCLALTRDLANAAAAFSVHASRGDNCLPPVDPIKPRGPPHLEAHGVHDSAIRKEAHSGASGNAERGTPLKADSSPPTKQAPKDAAQPVQQQQQQQQQPQPAAGAVKAGTGLSRPILVTALEFLSPYPLVMATSTGGAVIVWRTSDCVCVQAILLPADLGSLRRRHGTSSNDGAEEDEGTAEDEENLTCLARGTCTSAVLLGPAGREEEDVSVVYVGNGSGDIVAAHLSRAELAELSGDAKGPVPCQRRPNYNPYRAVRVELRRHAAHVSLQAACSAQRKAAAKAGTGGAQTTKQRHGSKHKGPTRDPGGGYNFAVPSASFHLAWRGHSAAVSSLSWIRSPPSLLSSSADGLAKIWVADGSAQLGQLDINNKRPERALFLPAESHRQWAFVPGSSTDYRHQSQLLFEYEQDEVHPTADGQAELGGSSEGTHHGQMVVEVSGAGNEEVGIKGDNVDERAAKGGGTKGRRERSRLRQEQPHQLQQGKKRSTSSEHAEAPPSPDSLRFSTSIATFPESAARTTSPERNLRGGATASKDGKGHGSSYVASTTTRKRRTEAGKTKPSTSFEVRTKGFPTGKKPSWMSGWDCMTRQLKDFEETLEASSSVRKKKVNAFHLGKSSSSASAQPARKLPLRGKRWRTKHAPWSAQDDKLLEESVPEQGPPTAGSTRLAAHKGMGGYVKPISGSAEEAALKRSRSRGATGMMLKDTLVDQSRRDSLKGRPLDEWLALPGGGRDLPASDPPGIAGGEEVQEKTIKGLPPMAILAVSHGGRLVASGITVAGDRGGGGFNVKAARAAARTALREATIAQQLAIEEERKAKMVRTGPRNRVVADTGCRRRQRQGLLGSRRSRERCASPLGVGQHQDINGKPSRKPTTGAAVSGSTHSIGNHSSGGSLAPSFGGTVHSSGSVASGGNASNLETEASHSVGPSAREAASGTVAEAARKLRGLEEDRVFWASSMGRFGRSRSSSKNRRRWKDGAGQVETIQRLVHMGMI